MSFAGVFTTHRRAAEADAITFAFEDFQIQPAGNNCQTPVNQAPVAVDDSETTIEDVAVNVAILVNDQDSDGTIDPATVDLDPSSAGTEEVGFAIAGEGTYAYDNVTELLTFTPETGFIGTSTLTYTVKDDQGEVSNAATVTLTVNPTPPATCSPLSTLDCADLDVDVTNGFCLDFTASSGGLLDGAGFGSGFTMVVDPSAPLTSANDPTLPAGAPTNPNVDGYEPSLLSISGGQLTIAASKGIMFSTPGSSTETNSSVNHLGVAFDANLTQAYDIETEMVNLPAVGTDASFHQGGLWFGLDEANYIKLVVIRNSNAGYRLQLAYEENDLGGSLVEENSPVILNTGDDVILRMTLDPTANTAAGFYSLDGGATFSSVGAGPISVGAALFQGINLPDASGPFSFAGVHATIRRGSTGLDFTFEDFCINPSAVQVADLNGNVDLQSRSDNSSSVTVTLYQPGTSTVVNTFTTTADANGDFAITGIPAGTYDVAVKPDYFLQVMQMNVALPSASTVSFGQCNVGDANNDNFVTGLDFTILSGSFNLQSSDPGFQIGADFNGDGFVTGLDFTILSGNFNTAGQQP